MGGGKEMLVEVDNQVGAKKGQLVEIVFDSGAFLTGSFLAYIAPVLALITGAFFGQAYGPLINLEPDTGRRFGSSDPGFCGRILGLAKGPQVERQTQVQAPNQEDFGPGSNRLEGPNRNLRHPGLIQAGPSWP